MGRKKKNWVSKRSSNSPLYLVPAWQISGEASCGTTRGWPGPATSKWVNFPLNFSLDLPSTQDSRGKWRFRLGFPYSKWCGWRVDPNHSHGKMLQCNLALLETKMLGFKLIPIWKTILESKRKIIPKSSKEVYNYIDRGEKNKCVETFIPTSSQICGAYCWQHVFSLKKPLLRMKPKGCPVDLKWNLPPLNTEFVGGCQMLRSHDMMQTPTVASRWFIDLAISSQSYQNHRNPNPIEDIQKSPFSSKTSKKATVLFWMSWRMRTLLFGGCHDWLEDLRYIEGHLPRIP